MGAELVCTGCNACQGCYAACDVCNACQSCNSCMTCLTCEGCVSCQSCVACESCNTCQGTCDTTQAFCFTTGQLYGNYGSFSFSYQPVKNNIMGPGYFDQDVWNEIITYINRMLTKGKIPSGSAISMSTTSDVAPFKASEFNRIAAKAGGTPVSSGDVIYGAYFQNLETAVVKQQLSPTACDNCNTGCNVQCDKCLSCDSGITDECGSGQACAEFTPQACNQSNGHICSQTTTVCCGCNSCNICLVCVTGEDSGDNGGSGSGGSGNGSGGVGCGILDSGCAIIANILD